LFWVVWRKGQKAEDHDRDSIRARIDSDHLADLAGVLVCPKTGRREWEPITDHGFQPYGF
jgi:hypothetical protein